MPPRSAIATIVLLLGAFVFPAVASDLTAPDLDRGFAGTVYPFLETYCFSCHGKEKQKGKLDLSSYSKMEAVALDYRLWEIVLEKLKTEEMPPEDAKRHPAQKLRRDVIDWIQAMRRHEAQRNAGDPGPVPARRLSNAEYDYTIRDLMGVDLRPAREFPVDPANEAGFDNSAESLRMSPVLLKKYLEAARRVAEHLVLKPEGFVFAPHPGVTETDRDKYCVKRIVDFYQRQSTDLADYFRAAWRFNNRARLGRPKATLADFAATDKVSFKYLGTIWSTVAEQQEAIGPIATLQAMWRELPALSPEQPGVARAGCERMRDFVVGLRQRLKPEIKNLSIRGIAPGSQPLVLWKDRQFVANRRRYERSTIESRAASKPKDEPEPDARIASALDLPADPSGRARYEAALDRFCRIFPDAFYVSERVLIFLQEDKESRGRLLSAGFHLMTGYFRDDAPLSDLILDAPARRELDGLWDEFHFITLDPLRQYKDFIFFERAEPPRFMQGAEFDFARSEDKDATSEAKIQQLAEAYLAKARRNGGGDAAITAIQDYFKSISAEIRWVEKTRLTAEPSHLQALLTFAERAYRRALSSAERDDLLAFYTSSREKEGLDHEEAMRDTVVSVLMSPSFCYHVEFAETAGRPPRPISPSAPLSSGRESAHNSARENQSRLTPAATVQGFEAREDEGFHRPAAAGSPNTTSTKWKALPLSDYALASRLSYFLWSSLPDAELLARAKAGDLHRPRVLLAQTRRMLQDDRVRGLASEFGGNWLDFRRFEEHNAVDRERFKSFNNDLRQAMFEEPIRFFITLVREDRPVLDFVYGDYTFVSPILARHYGMTDLDVRSNEWVRVDAAGRYARGGLLPMSVFLTRNAPGLRTSPVKRGYWVVRRLLGERIPPPPPQVPELPNDEAKLGDLTLRETLARHRDDKNCAGCHVRFDSIGLVFEGYGPVGERRTKDFGGRLVDTRATFPDGSEGTGLDGLRGYLREHRQEEFLDNLCRKLLAYALGRGLLLSDDALVHNMRAKLSAQGQRFSSLVETIVTSPQFLNRRDHDDLSQK